MATDIVVKDRDGDDVIYEGVETVTFDTPDGGTATFSLGDGGSVQADWAQNDDTQTDYVKNRPGGYVVSYPELDYTFDGELDGKEYSSATDGSFTYAFARCGDPVEDVQRFIGATIRMRSDNGPIIEESTVTGFAYNSFWGAYAQNGKSDASFEGAVMITGETGHVTWDGTTYECPVQDASGVLGAGWWALGNCTEFGLSGNDEPFIIAIADGEPPIYVALTDTEEGGSHSVAVTGSVQQDVDVEASYIIDLDSIIGGGTPGTVYMIGELFAINALAQTDIGQFWTALIGTEQPSQIISPGLYLLKIIYGTQLMYSSELLIPAATTTVEIPEKYTEVKSNKLGGYWFDGATLTWDGNTEGMEQLGELYLYRISEDVIPATLPVTLTGTTESGASDLTVDSLSYLGTKNNPIAGFGLVEDSYPLLYVVYADQTVDGISVKKGTYAFAGDVEGTATYISKITVASGWAKWPEQLTDVSTLQTDVSTLQTDVSTLQTDVSTLQTDVSTLNAESVRNKSEKWETPNEGVPVFYAAGKYIRPALSSEMVVSDDGIWWNSYATDDRVINRSLTYQRPIAYGNGVFVCARGTSKYPGWSTDGETWTFSKLNTVGSVTTDSVAFGGGKFVAINTDTSTTYMLYSDDGITWTQSTLPDKVHAYSIAYGNGRFVILANDANLTKTVALYSDDGVTWDSATVTSNSAPIPYYLAFGAGRFVGYLSTNGILGITYSSDGATWEFASTNGLATYSATAIGLVYTGAKFFMAFAAGSAGCGMWSDDGINWDAQQRFTDINAADYPSGQCVCFANGKLLLSTGYNKLIWGSEDGVNWSCMVQKLVDGEGNNLAPAIETVLGTKNILPAAQEYTDMKTKALGDNYVILTSSTEGSTKQFMITVDDSGTLSATEITT